MKFVFIREEKANAPVTTLCKTLGVSRSGFYAWSVRPESRREREDRKLSVLVRESHVRSRRAYGSPRVCIELRKQGLHVGRKRIMRLMRNEGLRARPKRRYRLMVVPEGEQLVAPNLLAQQFEATRPNERWVSDTTELVTPSGRLFLAAVIDLYSRFVVGWSLSAVNDRHLVIRALDMALRRRSPNEKLLHHSDQGSPYTSEDYLRVLTARSITCSMSRRGNCYDNAVMESWFSTLKFELGERFATMALAKAELFDYIEVFYNQQRMHSSIGDLSPAEFERQHQPKQAA